MTRHLLRRGLSALVTCLSLVGLCACAHQPTDYANSKIAGLWKHADKSAWIQIDFQDGRGSATIVQHDGNAGAQGLALFEEIREAPGATETWHGKMYSAEVDDFVDVSLELIENGALVITTLDENSETTEVLRLIRQ